MILTEADLHAYNRGELSPEASAQLEADPLAVEDAARLRAIAMAVRDEAEIPVLGRAETLARFRRAERPQIGIPGWVWATGLASVAGLIVISLPAPQADTVQFRTVSWSPQAESASSSAQSENRDANPPAASAPMASTAAGVQNRSQMARPETASPNRFMERESQPQADRARAAKAPTASAEAKGSAGQRPRTRQSPPSLPASRTLPSSRSRVWLYVLFSAPIAIIALVLAFLRLRR